MGDWRFVAFLFISLWVSLPYFLPYVLLVRLLPVRGSLVFLCPFSCACRAVGQSGESHGCFVPRFLHVVICSWNWDLWDCFSDFIS